MYVNDKPIRVHLIPECSACIVHSINRLIPLLTSNPDEQAATLRFVYRSLAAGYASRTDPLPLSIGIYQGLYERFHVTDPYRELKEQSTTAALKALPKIEKRLSSLHGYSRLRAVLAACIAGNMIDFNTAGHEPVLEGLAWAFEEILSHGFDIDHTSDLWQSLTKHAGSIAILADNAGEAILDIPLLRFLRDLDWDVFYVVKGRPMINDATREDISGTEIDSLAHVIDSGAWAHGVPRDLVSDEFLESIKTMDLILSKGQANIESFPEIQDALHLETFYITRAKCAHIARMIGARKGDNVVLHRHAI